LGQLAEAFGGSATFERQVGTILVVFRFPPILAFREGVPVQLVIATPSELEALLTGGVYDRKRAHKTLPTADLQWGLKATFR